MSQHKSDKNLDQGVIDDFGREWATFNYSNDETAGALDAQFAAYCAPIDLTRFNPHTAIACDFGAGSGRWSSRLIPYFSVVHVLEPSQGAIEVLKKKFAGEPKVNVLRESVGLNSIPNSSLDFAMSLGVLHHIPDTALAIKEITRTIKPGGVFLCYLYYNLEEKPIHYRVIFRIVNALRLLISTLPHPMKRISTFIIAVIIYLPLARLSKLLAKLKMNTSNFPLHHYADMPFIMLANDALDRFGTSLEQRFSKSDIIAMLDEDFFDLKTLRFSEIEPFWTFAVSKKY